MVFDSIGALRSYVLGVMGDCATLCAEQMLEIMRQEIENAYSSYAPSMYSRTMDLMNTPTFLMANSSGMATTFADNGGWYSLVGSTKGQHFFALYGLEGGSTWGRGATNIYDTSVAMCYAQIPAYYKQCMIAFGIPVV